MFHNSFNTRMTAWELTEFSEWAPSVAYPALVGSGRLVLGLDATGMQGLPDRLAGAAGSSYAPFHVTQADLYVLHEGMVSKHLYYSEVEQTGTDILPGAIVYGMHRNFMPLGYLDQIFDLNGRTLTGEGILPAASQWERKWDLKRAILTNSLVLDKQSRVEVEIFVPYGSESTYLKLKRHAAKGDGDFRWRIQLCLKTRSGSAIYDQPGAIQPGEHTVLATIDERSKYVPAEPYTVIYGLAAEGMETQLNEDGWTASMTGRIDEDQVAFLRLDFYRLAGNGRAFAGRRQAELEEDLADFGESAYLYARQQHEKTYKEFWENTADIEVEGSDALENTRRFMLHFSEYLLHCGSDFGSGGSPQFAFFHQNGWGASNFHDAHYVVDGIARANLWPAARSHAYWLKRVMRARGRAFPWMMTYDGGITAAPEVDRAPMSDAGRALLAMRLYELSGEGKDRLLSDVVYPIIKRVADMAVEDWFCVQDGRMVFRGVECDVMGDEAVIHEASTVLAFLTVIRKAIAYSEKLGVDAEHRDVWQHIIDTVTIDTINGRYVDHLNAPADGKASGWLCHSYYVAESQRFLDDAVYAATSDYSHRRVSMNLPWIGFAAACSEIRLGRPDRAEQYFVDTLENRTHGPGYYEECYPLSLAAIPPFATAHGAHLITACEQIVLSDFWEPRIIIGRGMPSKLRASRVHFSSLRARDGILISGVSDPRRLCVTLYNTGDAVEETIILSVPCEAGVNFQVFQDGSPVSHEFHGETVTIPVKLHKGRQTDLTVEG